MKLDIDYIERILAAVEEHDTSMILQRELVQALDTEMNDEKQVDKFYYHMKRIEDVDFLTSTHDAFGFRFVPGRGIIYYDNTNYELTWAGHRFLDALRSDTLKEKVKSWFLQMSIEQIKQRFPTLLIELLMHGVT